MLFYRLLLSLLTPLIILALSVRVLRKQERFIDLLQRLGMWRNLPRGAVVWIHGASNGELTAARPIIAELAERDPSSTLLITCNTISARKMVLSWGLPRTDARLAPLDLRHRYRGIMTRMDLQKFILLEADHWPNRILCARKLNIPLALVGGRISQKSANSWSRFSRLAAQMFSSFDLISAQDDSSEKRLRDLGASQAAFCPQIALKSLYHGDSSRALDHEQRRLFWLAASTHEGEDEVLLRTAAEAQKHISGLQMILAPRHPKRAPDILKIAKSLDLKTLQRSEGHDLEGTFDVFLADTLGEMGKWYEASGVCFVAGSLIAKGGHTPYEPAYYDCALLHGPFLENFAEPYANLQNAKGAKLCETEQEICAALIELQSKTNAETMRANARKALAATQNVTPVLDALDALAKT
ncbi:3-deoxy-D-manno-octulosonic acid transferase [Planktotalea sp.]|uniref:3-deoxy-D-manno-octulosonic acid transferase n=1 Tax=Planktotalea sp. TaxID=2029877 RepID=UPI003D6BEA73